MSPLLTIEFIQTQIVTHFRAIDNFFNLSSMQVNLQNQSA